MEEKIIEAQFTKNKAALIAALAGIALILFGLVIVFKIYSTGSVLSNSYEYYYDTFLIFLGSIMLNPFLHTETAFALLVDAGVWSILASLFFVWKMSRCTLTITNRRVTGKTSFRKAVDLPLNQISAVELGAFSKITVATSSGKIHFWFVKNRSDVHSALTEIIGKVQVESAYTQNNSVSAPSTADELKKFKELLDSGVITQEEFDAKKKQLLGL